MKAGGSWTRPQEKRAWGWTNGPELRALDILTEDQGSVPRTHIAVHNCLLTTVSEDLMPTFQPLWAPDMDVVHRYPRRPNIHTH